MSTVNDTAATFAAAMDEQAVSTDSLQPLKGDAAKLAEGSFVFTSQGTAAEQGFRNVSKLWYPKTLSYEQGLEQIEQGKSQTEDILATIAEMAPAVVNGSFAMQYKDGRSFRPTAHAVGQMGNWADTGTWYVGSLLSDPLDKKDKPLYTRDAGDAEALRVAFANGFRRLDPSKKFLWRTRQDGTLRAMLTERFAIVDNRWFLDRMKEFIPGGRLSHWRGDSDTIWGNVLIPDTIREEKDSDYGGMLSIGNSEIGERRVCSVPSIFRAICMNGCIWGATKGEGIRQVHRGEIDLDYLALEIKKNLNKQIPLLTTGIDRLLGTRTLGYDGVSLKPVVAQLAKQFKLNKKQANATLTAYNEERRLTPEYAQTLFGLTNAVTRAGQTLGNEEWFKLDQLGGELISFDADDFSNLIGRAKSLREKEVDEMYAGAYLSE
jgi:hypothetical protein